MARILEVHPIDPQKHRLNQAVDIIKRGGLVIVPTDSCYALACHIGDKNSVERMRRLKQLERGHLFTLLCQDLKDLSKFARVDNRDYRLLKALTPGPYTFILKASREVPSRLQTKRRKTIGIRVPDNPVVQSVLEMLNAPLLSTTAELPGADLPLNDATEIEKHWGHDIDIVLDAGSCGIEHTTIIDLSGGEIEVVRQGKGSVDQLLDN